MFSKKNNESNKPKGQGDRPHIRPPEIRPRPPKLMSEGGSRPPKPFQGGGGPRPASSEARPSGRPVQTNAPGRSEGGTRPSRPAGNVSGGRSYHSQPSQGARGSRPQRFHSSGGSRDPEDAYVAFRGREPEPDALLRRRGGARGRGTAAAARTASGSIWS